MHQQLLSIEGPALLPQQAFAALQRLQDRLLGRDSLLLNSKTADEQQKTEQGDDCQVVALTPATQSDACIRAAVDSERLAAMFEGWMAWV